MVVFTCNHCGDSLQKPRVEKHYQTVCRRNPSLTCVDCLKDFVGDEFVAHTKCLTEEERYAAKGSMPNGIVKKGESKQESWTEMIHDIIANEKNLPHPIRNLLNIISNNTNIPRKKPRFINYIRNINAGHVSIVEVNQAWDIIEKASNARKAAQNLPSKDDFQKRKSEDENGGLAKKTKLDKEAENNSQQFKVASNKNVNNENEINNTEGIEILNSENGAFEKKKKKKRTANNVVKNNESDETEDIKVPSLENKKKRSEDTIETEVEPKMNKSKKHKSENEILGNELIVEYDAITKDVGQKRKKSKKCNNYENKNVHNGIVTKSTNDTSLEITECQNQNGCVENRQENKKKAKLENLLVEIKDFQWEESIKRILSKKHQMTIEKLQKKVLNQYKKTFGENEVNAKVVKKFNKKLRKVEGVEISDDTVSLKE